MGGLERVKVDGAEPVVWEVSPSGVVIYLSSCNVRARAQS